MHMDLVLKVNVATRRFGELTQLPRHQAFPPFDRQKVGQLEQQSANRLHFELEARAQSHTE